MDLQGIPKRRWRAGIIEAYQEHSGEETLPYNRHFFTLGGPATEPGSELDYFHRHRRFCTLNQYVSVERDLQRHINNTRIKGPTWIHGDFAAELSKWHMNLPSGQEPGIVNFDAMCGMDNALNDIQAIIESIKMEREADVRGQADCLVVVNVLQSNRWRENQGHKFPDAISTFKERHARYWKYVVDKHQYHNKTVGKGSCVSLLQTLMFWI